MFEVVRTKVSISETEALAESYVGVFDVDDPEVRALVVPEILVAFDDDCNRNL